MSFDLYFCWPESSEKVGSILRSIDNMLVRFELEVIRTDAETE